jgi:GNAT superfamily N-acetyltransferase
MGRSMLNLHLEPLDVGKMTERQWNDLLSARTEFMVESRPNDPVPTPQEQRRAISNIPELRDHVVLWLFYDDDGHCVGFCAIQHPKPEGPDYEANKDRIYVEPVVLAPYRRQGAGTQLLPWIVQYAQTVGVSWVQWDTNMESGFRFSEKIGATEAGRQQTNRLAVDQVDWALMQRWVNEGQAHNPDVELIRFVNLPAPSLLDSFCSLVTDINRLQPSDSVEGMSFTLTPEELVKAAKRLQEQNRERVILCTREPDTTLSGMTDMYTSKATPTYAKVSLTGVRREYQGRGLGKWLKAAMMMDMRERYPDVDVVETENFNNNRPMLSINQRMGFRLFEQYVFYNMRVDDLEAKVYIR